MNPLLVIKLNINEPPKFYSVTIHRVNGSWTVSIVSPEGVKEHIVCKGDTYSKYQDVSYFKSRVVGGLSVIHHQRELNRIQHA